MAEIVLGGCLSHSPLLNIEPPAAARRPIAAYRAAATDLGARLRAARPDAVVIFAQDHFRTLFYDNMPAFLLGVGPVDRWGDWRGPTGALPTDLPLARHIARSLFAAGFEPSLSYDIKVDHGVAQAVDLLGLDGVPVVPVLINAAAPPLPTPARCHGFGAAVAAAIARFPGARRVVVVGSGGMSHAPNQVAIESEAPEDREVVRFLIHGRPSVPEREEARIAGFLGKLDHLASFIRPDWDRRILDRLAAGEAPALAAELDSDAIERDGGAGAQELRAWLAALGAMPDAAVSVLHYEPIPFLITGMGMILADRAAA